MCETFWKTVLMWNKLYDQENCSWTFQQVETVRLKLNQTLYFWNFLSLSFRPQTYINKMADVTLRRPISTQLGVGQRLNNFFLKKVTFKVKFKQQSGQASLFNISMMSFPELFAFLFCIPPKKSNTHTKHHPLCLPSAGCLIPIPTIIRTLCSMV